MSEGGEREDHWTYPVAGYQFRTVIHQQAGPSVVCVLIESDAVFDCCMSSESSFASYHQRF